jgi:hypothetical protein
VGRGLHAAFLRHAWVHGAICSDVILSTFLMRTVIYFAGTEMALLPVDLVSMT